MTVLRTPIPSGGAPSTRAIQLTDFSGGLNLRDDNYQIADNEVGDIVDLDIEANGGVNRRGTVRNTTTTAFGSASPMLLTQFVGNSVSQVVVGNQSGGADNIAYTSAGVGAPTLVALSGATTTSPWRSATMARITSAASQRLYIQRNAAHVVARFNGAAITDLGNAEGNYNENVAAAAGGFAPLAKLICAHKSFMFHGNIIDAAAHPSRIRWSRC